MKLDYLTPAQERAINEAVGSTLSLAEKDGLLKLADLVSGIVVDPAIDNAVLTGVQGPEGPAGPAGPEGAVGPQGGQGATGATGPQGPKGDKGDPGDQGIQGIPGATGNQGVQGPAGPQGPAGTAGSQGPAGATGATGPAGPMGPQGPAGDASGTFSLSETSANISPSVTTSGWTLSTGVTQDGGGIHFSGVANLGNANVTVAALEDNKSYDVAITIANFVNGKGRVIISGDTANHSGSITEWTGNGTFNATVTTSGSGSLTNQIRIQATGASNNTYDVTSLTVTPVAGSYPVRPMNTKVREIGVSLKDFGTATGSDWTQVMENAIASGEPVILIPPGTYNIETIDINNDCDIIGYGWNRSIINITGIGDIHGIKARGLASLTSGNRIYLSRFKLNYTGSGQTVAGTGPGQDNWSGLYVQRKVIADNLYINNFTNDGIYFACSDEDEGTGATGTIDNAVFFAKFSDVWSKNHGRSGCVVRRGANANAFYNCQFDRNGKHGFHHLRDGFSTYGNYFEVGQCSYNHDHGFYIQDGTNFSMKQTYAELNGWNGSSGYITSGAKDFWFGDAIVRSKCEIGVLYNADTDKVRLPFDAAWGTSTGGNTAQIQIWEGGRRGYGAT